MPTDKKPEMVDHPKHYGGDVPYEVIKVLRAWLSPEAFRGWLLGTIIKYLPRAEHKGHMVEDLKKARWYLDYFIKYLEEPTSVPKKEVLIDGTLADSISGHLFVQGDRDEPMEAVCRFCSCTRMQFIKTAFPHCARKHEAYEADRDHG